MYILKVKGQVKIPDFIQLRDKDFRLIAYFRVDRPLKDLDKYGLDGKEEQLKEIIQNLEVGTVKKIDL